MESAVVKLKANDLLKSFLRSAQRKDWDAKGWFEVRGSDGNTYRLSVPGEYWCTVQRVWPMGLRFKRRCIQSCERLPASDVILAAKVWIEANETEFLRTIGIERAFLRRIFSEHLTRRRLLPWDLPLH